MRRQAKASSYTRMADAELRKLALERDNYRCRKCGASATEFVPLDTAHLAAMRRFRRTRWELDNVAILCRKDHVWLDTHPYERETWVKDQIGEERYDELRRMAEDGQKVVVKDILAQLRAMRRESA